MTTLRAPFPYLGGKSRIAPTIWRAFGDVRSYVEPFAGSLAVLLARPRPFSGSETVNDADGLLANFWRAMTRDPTGVAAAADWPVNEADLHARHLWLVGNRERITERLMGNPDWCDVRAAGWWVWGICSWIGSGWCSGSGPWVSRDGVMVDSRTIQSADDVPGVNRQRPHLGNDGCGVNRKLPHLADDGRGVNRQLPHLSDDGHGVSRPRYWLGLLAERLRYVRVACGDWSRVCGRAVTHPNVPVAAIFLDPPYGVADRSQGIYALDSLGVSAAARDWAIAHGDDPAYRIVLAGYDTEHGAHMPASWRVVRWEQGRCYAKSAGHYENSRRECLWLSPHCLPIEETSRTRGRRQTELFG